MNLKNYFKKSFISLVVLFFAIIIFNPVEARADDSILEAVYIVHTNDVHSRVENFPKVSAILEELREKSYEIILIDAGDAIHGQNFATLSNGESVMNLYDLLGYDVLAPGNHDFNYGKDRLIELDENSELDIIAANVLYEDTKEHVFKPYVTRDYGNLSVGIFGLATRETLYKTNPKNVEGLIFEDPVESAKLIVKELKDQDIDFIIAVSHLGVDESSEDTAYKLRDEVDGIDLIIDGHSHTNYEDIKQTEKALITQTGKYLENLGVIELKVEDSKVIEKTVKNIEDLKELENSNEDVSKFIEEVKESYKDILSEVIGKASVNLEGAREKVRTGQTNLGSLVTNAMKLSTESDMAITNGGGIRESINEGEITKEHVLNVFPFGNYVVTLEGSGQSILNILNHGTSSYPEAVGMFPHVSGVTYEINLNNESGSYVENVKINGEDLVLDKTYIIATNDFMAVGGDGYEEFKELRLVNEFSALDEILIDYLKEIEEVDELSYDVFKVHGNTEEKEELEDKTETEEKDNTVDKPKYQEYSVKNGDILWKIGVKFNTTWQELQKINNIKNPHVIIPGQKLLVPAA